MEGGGWRVEGGGIWRCVFLCVVLWVRGEVVRLNNLSGGADFFVVATPFLLFANGFLAVVRNRYNGQKIKFVSMV